MTPPRRFDIADLPVWLSAVLMLAGGFLLLLNLAVGALNHGRYMKLCAQLDGVVQPPEKMAVSLPNLLSGRYQAALAQRIGAREPFFPVAVRLHNQLELSLLGVSPTPEVTVGRHSELLETRYIDEYCTRDVATFMLSAPAWAGRIRQMQDEIQRNGAVFLYVLTPSKVAQYPDDLPAGLPCAATDADRKGTVPAWDALVRRAGIHFVNTTQVLDMHKPDYPFPLFPRGGTHWNQAGAALAAQAIAADIDTRRPGAIPAFDFTWQLSAHPTGTDLDLMVLMNLFWPPDHFIVPVVSLSQPGGAACHPARITIVGGSFMEGIGATVSRLPCHPDVVEYWYWSIYRGTWRDGKEFFSPVIPAQRDADLRHADVVIYEENEQLLGHSKHGVLFYQWLTGVRNR